MHSIAHSIPPLSGCRGKYPQPKAPKSKGLSGAVSLLHVFPWYAADDPLSIVNNLSDFIFSCIRAIGVIILGWGIVQVGMSVQSHDASQRTQGFLCLFGGLLIAFAKEILGLIGVV